MDINLKIPAIEQLIKITASGIGAVVGPMVVRQQARASADAYRIEAQGKADSIMLIADAQAKARESLNIIPSSTHGEIDVHGEIQARLAFQEEKRQCNIESVVGRAADELGESMVQSHDIDHDWTARFFADVQDVSSEGMQRIWAKILAGEVETPGRTSMQTLSILKNMSQRDAELFQRTTSFVIDGFVLHDKSTTNVSGFPIYEDFLRLSHHNLVHLGTGLSTKFRESSKYFFFDSDVAYLIYKDSLEIFQIAIPCHVLTPSGMELYTLGSLKKNDDYMSVLANFLNRKCEGKLAYAQILSKAGVKPADWQFGVWKEIEPHVPPNWE